MSTPLPALQTVARPLLLIGVSALLYLIWAGLNRPLDLPDKPEASDPAAAPEATPQDARPAAPEMADYAIVVERPLFFAERTPYVALAPDPPPDRPGPTSAPMPGASVPFTLSAIVISAGQRLAVIHYGRDNKQQRIALGQSIDGWAFAAIEPRSVLVRKGDQAQTLELAIKPSSYIGPSMTGDPGSGNGAAR